jgi:hypothetical protein
MLSAEFKKLIAPQAKMLNIIWGAIMIAPVLYVAVAWFMFGQAAVSDPGANVPGIGRSNLNLIGVVMLLILGLGSTLYERKSLGASVLEEKLARDPDWSLAGSKGTPGVTEDGRGIFENLSDSEKRLACLWPHFQTNMIVVWALREAIAVVGLVLAILQEDFRVVIPFAAAAVILMLMKLPRPTRFFTGIRVNPYPTV